MAAKRHHASLARPLKSDRHANLWLHSLELYAFPKFGKRPLHTVGTVDVLSALSPIWTEKHETAKRLKQRLSTIFDWAKGVGHYPHESPVNALKT